MCLQMAKMVFVYDMELVDPDLDWEAGSRVHFVWWKPELRVRFLRRDAGD